MNHLAQDGVPTLREFALTRIPGNSMECSVSYKSDWHNIEFIATITDLQLLDIGGIAHIVYPGKYMINLFADHPDQSSQYVANESYIAMIYSYAAEHDNTILQQ